MIKNGRDKKWLGGMLSLWKRIEIVGNRKKCCSKACGEERSRRQCCERGKARYRALSPEQKKELAMKRKQAKPKKVKGTKEPKYRNELVRVVAERSRGRIEEHNGR